MFNFVKLKPFLQRVELTCKNRNIANIAIKNDKTKIDKILISNRGEIACRVIRTAKKLGIKTVAVYSDVDKNAMHVEMADEAYLIGPAPSSQSYLRQDKIVSVAKSSKCQAIHPGYGFLSENVEFAELCQKENLIFIGPPASAIKSMGIKSTSKIIMEQAGVPVIQGYHGKDQSNDSLFSEAKKIGFPLMIKAIRGGGGKGMRIAQNEEQFLQALESAKTESQKSFGDSNVLLEQFVNEPRHVEVQVFADKYGNAVHLFERDCSVQRRHQKVIEEAPAPNISWELRTELGSAAVKAAKAIGYVGAGTVEFIMDRFTNKFHFMEMNTRLQVEHPVTEAITSTDLVEWQIKVASGEELPMRQEEIKLHGHAFETRVYAEDPEVGFLPGAGKLLYLDPPQESNRVRVETGVRQNDEVSVHYDPMIAKLVTWGKTRDEALNLMHSKLSEYHIAGLETNIEFVKNICKNKKFQIGEVHTGFIEENRNALFPTITVPSHVLFQGVLALILNDELSALEKGSKESDNPFNPFILKSGLRLNHILCKQFRLKIEKEHYIVDVQYIEPNEYLMRINANSPWQKVSGKLTKQGHNLELKCVVGDLLKHLKVAKIRNDIYLFTNERKWRLSLPSHKYVNEFFKKEEISSNVGVSPIPGVVDKILVNKGDKVKVGDSLVVIYAMKMEYLIKATMNGQVQEIFCKTGQSVAKDAVLIKLQEASVKS